MFQNGEQCLNCLSQPRGQPHSWSKPLAARAVPNNLAYRFRSWTAAAIDAYPVRHRLNAGGSRQMRLVMAETGLS